MGGSRQIGEKPVMTEDLSKRIDAMFRKDAIWGYGFVVALWMAYFYVFFAIRLVNVDSSITLAMLIGGAMVLVYNTASMIAMVRHYAEDKEFIYSIDIRHLDEMRGRKQAQYGKAQTQYGGAE